MWPGSSDWMKKRTGNMNHLFLTLPLVEEPQGSDKEVGNSEAIPREELKLSGVRAPWRPLREWQGSHSANTLLATPEDMKPSNVFCYLTISRMCMMYPDSTVPWCTYLSPTHIKLPSYLSLNLNHNFGVVCMTYLVCVTKTICVTIGLNPSTRVSWGYQ